MRVSTIASSLPCTRLDHVTVRCGEIGRRVSLDIFFFVGVAREQPAGYGREPAERALLESVGDRAGLADHGLWGWRLGAVKAPPALP